MQAKFKVTEEMEKAVLENFREIAGTKVSFSAADFISAKQKNP